MDTPELIGLAVAVYALIAILTGIYVVAVKRASVFEPAFQYLFFLALFTLPLPIRAMTTLEVEGNVTPQIASLAPYLPFAVLLSAVTMPVFCLAYYSRFARAAAAWLPRAIEPRRDHGRLAFLVLTLFSAWLVYLLTEEVGGILPFLLLGYKSSEETFGRGYLAIGLPWLFVASMLAAYRFARTRSALDAAIFVCTVAANAAMHVLTGNRGMLMYMGIVLLTFVHFAIRRLRAVTLLALAVAAFVGLNALGVVRGSEYESVEEFAERSTATGEEASSDLGQFFYTLTIGEFVVPFETLPQMIRSIGLVDPPWFGWSYLRSPVFLVPSAVFPDRPLPLANWYMQRFYGEGYGLNEGRAFFFLAEGYLNFLFAGPLLVAIVWGILWGALQQWLTRSSGSPATVMLYALTTGFMFRCIRGDAMTIVAGLTQQSLVPALLGLIFAGVVFQWRRSTTAS